MSNVKKETIHSGSSIQDVISFSIHPDLSSDFFFSHPDGCKLVREQKLQIKHAYMAQLCGSQVWHWQLIERVSSRELSIKHTWRFQRPIRQLQTCSCSPHQNRVFSSCQDWANATRRKIVWWSWINEGRFIQYFCCWIVKTEKLTKGGKKTEGK